MATEALHIHGAVGVEVHLTVAAIAATEPRIADVAAVVPKRSGRGVWLRDLVTGAEPDPQAQWASVGAADGFELSVPLGPLLARGIVLYERDGGPLPVDQGGPLRLLLTGSAACGEAELDACANVKNLVSIRVTRVREPDVGHQPHPRK